MKFNKTGQIGDQSLLFVFVFIMVVISGTLFISVLVFYGDGIDIRRADSNLLSRIVSDCLEEKGAGILNDKAIFLKNCELNSKLFNDNSLGIKICSTSDLNCADNNVKGVLQIGSNFESCFINSKNDAFPVCSLTSVKLGEDSYEIIVFSNQRTILERGT